jgi:hypothetical protein
MIGSKGWKFFWAGILIMYFSYSICAWSRLANLIFFISGIILILVSIGILFNENKTPGILSILFLIVAFFLLQFVKHEIKAWSYRLLISRNHFLYDEANRIIITKKENTRYWLKDDSLSQHFTGSEIQLLHKLSKSTGTRYIEKGPYFVYYSMDGFMNNDFGLWYSYGAIRSLNEKSLKISDRWQYY